jgi:hypothetical protein
MAHGRRLQDPDQFDPVAGVMHDNGRACGGDRDTVVGGVERQPRNRSGEVVTVWQRGRWWFSAAGAPCTSGVGVAA